MLLLCTSPSRPAAFRPLRGRVDQEIDPYGVQPNFHRICRGGSPSRPRVDGDIDPYDLHRTCRGGYQPPAGRWEIDPYRPQSLASLAKAGRALTMVSRATQ